MTPNIDFKKSVLITTIGAACATLPVLLVITVMIISEEFLDWEKGCYILQILGCFAFLFGLHSMRNHLTSEKNLKGIKALSIAVGIVTLLHLLSFIDYFRDEFFLDALETYFTGHTSEDSQLYLLIWASIHTLLWWGCKQLNSNTNLPLEMAQKAYIFVGIIPIISYIIIRLANLFLENNLEDLEIYDDWTTRWEMAEELRESHQSLIELISIGTFFGLFIATCVAIRGWYYAYQNSNDNPEDYLDNEEYGRLFSTASYQPEQIKEQNIKAIQEKSLDELKNIITHPEFYAPEYIELAKEVCFNREKTMAALATKTDAELQEIINKPVIYAPANIAAARDELKRRGK